MNKTNNHIIKQKQIYLLLIVLSTLFISCKTTHKTSNNFKMIFDDVNSFQKMYDKIKLIENDYLKK